MKSLQWFFHPLYSLPTFASEINHRAMKQVIISTSSLNSYGSRVLTSGVDLSQYQRNPVLLWMHRRYGREDMPIGRIENIRVEGDKIIGTPVFDESDEFAMKIANKWENDMLRMASAGLTVIELSDDPALLLPGQTRMTISKSKLDEVSIVDIGANDDALAVELYNQDGKRITLGKGEESADIPLIQLKQQVSPITNETMNEQIALALGLPTTASEAEVISAIAQLKKRVDEANSLQQSIIQEQISDAIQCGKITESQREHYSKIGAALGGEMLRQTLANIQAGKRPSSIIQPQDGPTPTQFKKLSDVPTDELEQLRKNDYPTYARLYKAEFGVEVPQY